MQAEQRVDVLVQSRKTHTLERRPRGVHRALAHVAVGQRRPASQHDGTWDAHLHTSVEVVPECAELRPVMPGDVDCELGLN